MHKYERIRHKSKEPKINMKLKRTLDIVQRGLERSMTLMVSSFVMKH